MNKWTWVTVLSAYGIGALLFGLASITITLRGTSGDFSALTATDMFLAVSGTLSLVIALLTISVTNHD